MRKTYNYILFSVLTFVWSGTILAQGVKIGGQVGPPDPSAGLEVDFSDKGFLGPRLTTAQRNSIPAPVLGLFIYNTDSDCFEGYTPNGWRPLACGCAAFPSFQIVSPLPPVVIGVGFPLVLSTQSPNQTLTYSWQIPGATPSSSVQSQDTVVFSQVGTYTAIVTGTDSAACSTTDSVSISVLPCTPGLPQATITGPQTVVQGSTVTFQSTAGMQYAWSFQGGNPAQSTSANPQVSWASTGTYTISLTVTDPANGCSTSSTAQVQVVVFPCRNFTNASAAGRNGPSQSQVNSAYNGTALQGEVSVVSGIQEWIIPFTATYRIEAWGAQGGAGTSSAGFGARMRGDFALQAGDTLRILVGQQGSAGGSQGGGGGGTFVWLKSQTQNPLLAAGGGGGGGASTSGIGGDAGTSGTNPNDALIAGGTNGQPGQATPPQPNGSNSGSGAMIGGSGAGWLGDGLPTSINVCSGTYLNSHSPLNGGRGGAPSSTSGRDGGFGGGGSGNGSCGTSGGGGGGGYSGGAASSCMALLANGNSAGTDCGRGGGGGGSFNSGANQSNSSGVRSGHGAVTICIAP